MKACLGVSPTVAAVATCNGYTPHAGVTLAPHRPPHPQTTHPQGAALVLCPSFVHDLATSEKKTSYPLSARPGHDSTSHHEFQSGLGNLPKQYWLWKHRPISAVGSDRSKVSSTLELLVNRNRRSCAVHRMNGLNLYDLCLMAFPEFSVQNGRILDKCKILMKLRARTNSMFISLDMRHEIVEHTHMQWLG